jgi:hypothetical protein
MSSQSSGQTPHTRPETKCGTAYELIRAEIPRVDEAIRRSEAKWGVGRLSALVSPDTLIRWKRGWDRWSEAVIAGHLDQVREFGPKIIAALAYMDTEATRLGHNPLVPQTWEARCPDGRVLVVVRSLAEAHHVARQQDGRATVCYTMQELAELLPLLDQINAVKIAFPGAVVQQCTLRSEAFANDLIQVPELIRFLHGELA